jgi:hypothetical protein
MSAGTAQGLDHRRDVLGVRLSDVVAHAATPEAIEAVLLVLMLSHAPFVEERPAFAGVDDVDAGHLGAAEIEGDPLGLAVIECGEQSLA